MNEMKPEMITVISVVQGEAPQVQTIENNPQVFEAVIGHSVQTIHPFVDAVALVESSDQDLNQPFNRALYNEDGEFMDSVQGPFFIVGYENKQWASVPEDLIPTYLEKFRVPEQRCEIEGKHYILPTRNDTSLYLHSASYAREHGESEQYRASLRANIECKEAIGRAVYREYDGASLNAPMALAQVLAQFSAERVQYVLAVTVQDKLFDGRISEVNKIWAARIETAKDYNRVEISVDRCHPCLMEQFVKCFRETAGIDIANQRGLIHKNQRKQHEPEL